MFAFICRRRLLLRLRQLPGDGGISPLQIKPGAVPLSSSYSLKAVAVAVAPNSEPCPTTISYLISCGLSPAAAAVTARFLRIRSTAKADAACALLRRYGFTDADITRVARSAPQLLSVDPDRIIRPKLDYFASLGFEPRKLASAPILLALSLDKHIVPCIQFLRGIIGTDDDLRLGFSRNPRALMVHLDNNMRPAVEALRNHGLTEEAISKLLVIQMGVLMLSPDRIGEVFEDLKAVGLCSVNSTRFLYCFRVMCGVKRETWLRKVVVYRSFGLSEGEVLRAFKTQPTILLFADENIKKKLRFFLDELKLESTDVIRHPVVLGSSLEKTILPRCAVLSVLMREGKIERDIRLLPALEGSSRTFSGKYVLRYANNVPDVVKAYEGEIKFQGFGYI